MAVVKLEISEIFEEAFERAGLEIRSGYDLKKVRRCFNILTNEWSNRGFNLWTVEEGSTAISAGDNTYSLDTNTVDILQAVVRDADGHDFNVNRIKLSEWVSKYDKTLTGMPSQMLVSRSKTTTDLILWPVPDDTYTLIWWRLRYMDGLSTGGGDGTSPDIPPRFVPAIIAGLAYHVAQSYGEATGRIPFLQSEYERQFDLAAGEDRERASVRLVPGGY